MQAHGVATALRQALTYLSKRLRREAPTTVPPVKSGVKRAGYLGPIWATLAQQNAFHMMQAPMVNCKRRKIAIIGDLNLVQCRKYRVEQLIELWATMGVDVTFSHYQDVPRAVHILQDATHLMCYRLQMCADVSMYLYEARRLKMPILYDIDDPLFSVSAYETYTNLTVLNPVMKSDLVAAAPGYLDVMNACDAISVSTPGLALHASEYSHRDVFVRRNFADSVTLNSGEVALRGRVDNEDVFRMSFASGSQGHEADFDIIRNQIIAFLSKDKNRRLMILGHFDRKHLPSDISDQIEYHKFTNYDRYLQTLAQSDCAVVPLADDLFNRCKSAVRAIDAASVGVPVVCGNIGDFTNIVVQGQTGIIATKESDWETALDCFDRDRSTAHAMGLRARCALEKNWSAQNTPHIVDPNLVKWVTA